jgi:hypothetical protein
MSEAAATVQAYGLTDETYEFALEACRLECAVRSIPFQQVDKHSTHAAYRNMTVEHLVAAKSPLEFLTVLKGLRANLPPVQPS